VRLLWAWRRRAAVPRQLQAARPALMHGVLPRQKPLTHTGPLRKRVSVKAATVVQPALRDLAEASRRAPEGHPMAAHLMIHLTESASPGSSADVPLQPGYAGEAGGASGVVC
jgi:hypothetical protein